MPRTMLIFIFVIIIFTGASEVVFSDDPWYTEGAVTGGDVALIPEIRIKITLINTLNFDRRDCPVIITNQRMPIKDLHRMWVTVVDPALPPRPPLTEEEKSDIIHGHEMLEESNGHQIFRQLDDFDRDGVWDELYFTTDMKANETRTLYIYIGFSLRGWNKHGTHAAVGSYLRHMIPFWENEHVGWKLWYADTCDFYGKRKSQLMSFLLYSENWCGYYDVPFDKGSDIMTVSNSFGAGALCLFEYPAIPDSVSRPRFTPQYMPPDGNKISDHNWNEGPITDTRYANEVLVNGPLRSMVRIKTMNWKTGKGFYELEQIYTAYDNQSYSTCKVRYHKFFPDESETVFGCGIRKRALEFDCYQDGGTVISCGKYEMLDPDDPNKTEGIEVEFVGNALIVKDEYKPEYQFVPGFSGNHTFKVPVRDNLTYEYLIAGAWSEGEVLNTAEDFKGYVIKTAREYNNPIVFRIEGVEYKE